MATPFSDIWRSRLNFRSSSPLKPMSKLTAIKKQIAALEAQAERIAKTEMSSAIAKIKDIMSEFNLTIEHLTQTVAGKRAAKKTKAKKASVAKYVDPRTGKTWSGVGRAPGWIAGAKNRDAFLVGKSAAAEPAVKVPAASKNVAAKAARKSVKPAAKRAVAAAKKASGVEAAPVAAKKKPATRKVSAKKVSAKKSAPKRAAAKRAAAVPALPTATSAA